MSRQPFDEVPKSNTLRIRLTPKERTILDVAAGTQGVSTWARRVLLREADRLAKRRKR